MSEIVQTEKLRQIVNKIETIEQERLESADLLKDTYNEAKAMGFDVKSLSMFSNLKRKIKIF